MDRFFTVNDGNKWIDGVDLHVLLYRKEKPYLCLREGGNIISLIMGMTIYC